MHTAPSLVVSPAVAEAESTCPRSFPLHLGCDVLRMRALLRIGRDSFSYSLGGCFSVEDQRTTSLDL